MKAIATKLFLMSLLLCTNEFSLFAKNKYVSMELSKINITDNIVDSLINKVICDNKEMLKENECFLLTGMTKAENGTNYVNIIIYEKTKFIIDEFKILGYSEIEGQIILVLGKLLGDKVQILKDKRKFAFRRKELWKKKSVPPPPPSMYNPPNYIFLYE
ncbi:hypothetical protein FQ707_14110 [Bacteroidaceae bacterium HV4-6-C5C]|jgi:hydrogenase maturation factor|nr:hypothetical protein FQ707_14110 [Bacteroidaceae bacterium HV4-6-C5C]